MDSFSPYVHYINVLIFLQLDWMSKETFLIFQNIKCFNVVPAQLCVPMSDYAFEMIYKKLY